jgi:hypothetical protein
MTCMFLGLSDPLPVTYVRGTDPRIRIRVRVRIKLSQIPNKERYKKIAAYIDPKQFFK